MTNYGYIDSAGNKSSALVVESPSAPAQIADQDLQRRRRELTIARGLIAQFLLFGDADRLRRDGQRFLTRTKDLT